MKLKEQSQRCLSLSQQIVYGSTDRALLPSENADTKRQCFQQEMEMGRWRHVSTPPPESIAMDPTARWQRRPSIDEEAKSIDYRRTDKPQGNDWEVLVRRILLNTDQQASVYLQQKLKTCNTDQKQAIFQMVHKNAYALMTNRFGNFLVQRLFEWGTPDQVQALANVMDGHILALTCEPFGCHVVQRALDNVNGETKTRMVMELCQHIPETITHKYACHVWQRVFEIRHMHQSVSVMQRVHQALQGKWTRVALDETGSLVIQNIFENLLEPDKRPVLDEILSNIEEIAKGQWGNWVIQHILEQAEQKQDRERAFDMVLLCGIQLSMDQYASKVVEKALSNGGPCYMERFIHHISTESRSYRPRIALIDIASDQYGNYVVQWIINNAADHHKISVCRLIKRHMVSLRGSKYGQRVAFLVEKTLKHHDVTTYPRH
ncbi:ARM repeat-containing protein [Hesseltinella vesiculosa]|uniref:ARM repeat-containing protein n=1 Tax=Hesseltinella vesiculosa TaxID=101127 RepID=A0A1X2GLH7_9FUNG|nr:ARM repeat-containing protein [Hesseltinella vesiculosa]